jgi:predicted Fe-S protein YdhL (DUF1289 family)
MPRRAKAAWLAWYGSTPDTPCIAICSTSQGDAQCKGCGRSFDEVQHWPAMSPGDKRAVWRRITLQATSWRFNRYAERAAERVAESPAENEAERAATGTAPRADGPAQPAPGPAPA